MQLVKLITPKKINLLHLKQIVLSAILVAFFFMLTGVPAMAQDNSPYSRYGIGDLVPSTNVNSRSMGGIAAGYADVLSINYNNPASYSTFQSFREAKSKKLTSGRAILDIGMNFENRTLREPNNTAVTKFVASNALFSHVQVGVPLSSNWGLSFGLRPVSRVSYKIGKIERLLDPLTNQYIDTIYTENQGDGGSYIGSVGTGFRIKINSKQFLSLGINAGYFFGKKDYTTRRTFLNDTVDYHRANYETRTTYGNLYFNAGLQYRIVLNEAKRKSLTIGAYGNTGQKLKGNQDIIRETFVSDPSFGNVQQDSVSIVSNIKGKIQYPASFTVGFVYEKEFEAKEAGWLFGVDFTRQKWDDYRFYGQTDYVANKWELRAGAQLKPIPKRNYFSNVMYRAGFFMGPDYIRINNQKLQQFGASFGMGLPLSYSRQAPNQFTMINVGFEFIKRGNNDNLLKENLFRLSLGFSVSDLWFIKRKYD